MTIAARQPRIDPRIAEREAREKKKARVAALELQRQRFDNYDPAASPSSTGLTTPPRAPRPQPCRAALIIDDITLHTFNMPARAAIDPASDENDLAGPLLPLPPDRRDPARALLRPLAEPLSRRALGQWPPRVLQRLHPGEARLHRP